MGLLHMSGPVAGAALDDMVPTMQGLYIFSNSPMIGYKVSGSLVLQLAHFRP